MTINLNITGAKLAKLFLLAFIFLSFKNKHPFYLSVAELTYNAKSQTLQASVKLFTNDIEDALKKIYKQPVDLINGKDKEAINKLLLDYIQKRFLVKADGKTLTFNLIGFENEEEAVWVYLESKNLAAPKKLEVENTLLFDFLKSQINIVNCDVNGVTKSSKVINPKKSLFFEF